MPDLKVKLKVKLVVGGCLGALEQDTPPPRSVLRIILKDPDFFDTVRKTSSSCPLFLILREKDGGRDREKNRFSLLRIFSIHSNEAAFFTYQVEKGS